MAESLEPEQPAGPATYVSEEGTAQRTEVGIAGLWEDHIAVNAGLQPDTRVVVEGGAYLTEGAAVALIE